MTNSGLPVSYPLEFVRGDTFRRRTFVMFTKGTEEIPPIHIPLFGAEVSAQIRVSEDAPDVLMEFDSGVDADGNAYIEASDTRTAGTGPYKRGVWDLQVSLSGETDTYLAGPVKMTKDVSR